MTADLREDWIWVDDPVAQQTDWRAARARYVEPAPVRLVRKNSDRLELRISRVLLLVALLFGAVGVAFMHAFSVGTLPSLALPIGLLPICIAIGLALATFTPVGVFDRGYGAYWRPPRLLHGTTGLGDIHAIQVLWQRPCLASRFRQTYEVNLVLNDGKCRVAAAHTDLKALRDHAEAIGKFLKIPVWDPTK